MIPADPYPAEDDRGDLLLLGESGSAESGSPAIASYVSLFLLLLVFFVVLFSIASVQQSRSDALVHSLDEAFGGLPSRIGLLPKIGPTAQISQDESRYGATIKDLLQPFATAPATGSASADLIGLGLGLDRLFTADGLRMTGQAQAALDRLAILLQRKIGETRFRVVWQAGRGIEPQAMALAQHLFVQGAPADSIAIQIGDPPNGRIGASIVPVPLWHGGDQD